MATLSQLPHFGRLPIKRYRVYGVTLATDEVLAVPLPTTDLPVDVTLGVVTELDEALDFTDQQPVYAEGKGRAGLAQFEFYRLPDRAVVRITGAMDFHCWADRIVCHLLDERHRYLLEVALFGMIMALWLELRGVVTLHASTVVIGGRAVAFSSGRGGGKTATAAAAIHAGHSLLSDDLLALARSGDEFTAQPGYPQVRMWPDQAGHFIGSEEGLEKFHPAHDKRRVDVGAGFGTFFSQPAALGAIYLPERADHAEAEVSIARLPPRAAMLALIRLSFLPREVVRFGLQPGRMEFLAALLSAIPTSRIVVPRGLDQLPRAVAAVESDLRAIYEK